MKTPEQLKGSIRNMAARENLRAQEVLQMFFLERILERLASTKFRDRFILKGGLLISAMIGIRERTTMDMDTTVRGIQMEADELERVIREILDADVQDGIAFEFQGMEPIREGDAYNNFRVHLLAKYGRINSPVKIDVTTGDAITPSAIQYDYPMMFEDRTIPVMAYALETILAEKYETVIRRGIGSTRARDFYDLHILYRSYADKLRPGLLKAAVESTAKKRGSMEEMKEGREILGELRGEPAMQRLWTNYRAENRYIGDLAFDRVLDSIEEIARMLDF